MSDRHQTKPYPLRLPDELRERLEAEAKTAGRSLNAEIAQRLEASFVPVRLESDMQAAIREAIMEVMAEMPIFGPPVENMLAVKPKKTKEK